MALYGTLAMLSVDSISAGTGPYDHGSTKNQFTAIEDIHIRSIYALLKSDFITSLKMKTFTLC